ncbi:MAG: ABC transporter ATP-binding protein/permease [Bacteroidales bacterium]|nr:ABC transporter ATP-binding protein/permease [Bacteroidales bacterium]
MYSIKNNLAYVIKNTWRHERILLFFILLSAVFGVLIPLMSIYLPSIILGGVTGAIPLKNLFFTLGILSICLCFGSYCVEYINALKDTRLINNKMYYLTELFKKKMTMDYQYVESADGQNQFQSVLNVLFNDSAGVSGMLTNTGSLLGRILGFSLYAGIISMLNPLIAVILIITSAAHLFILKHTAAYEYKNRPKWTVIDKKLNYLFGKTMDYQYNKEIKLYDLGSWLAKIIDTLIIERIRWLAVISRHNFFTVVSDAVILIIRDGLSYFYIFNSVFAGRIQVAEFALYFGAITGFSGFISGIIQDLGTLNRTSQDVSVMRRLFDMLPKKHEGKKLPLGPGETLKIEFDHVSFRYSEDSPFVLQDINFCINAGEKIALVGENGAGKTTLVKLLCGFYRPGGGEIYLNGVPVSELDRDFVYSLFAVVFQDIFVLPATAFRNIALTDYSQALSEDVRRCITQAGLDNAIPDLQLPLTKIIDERGVELSGGEAQKLMLARAIYKDAPGLILDEPTSALDPIAEKELYIKYNELVQKKTSIFISHRLSSTQFCNRILFLENGNIAESGSHQELMLRNGKYSALYKIQSQYYV